MNRENSFLRLSVSVSDDEKTVEITKRWPVETLESRSKDELIKELSDRALEMLEILKLDTSLDVLIHIYPL